MTFGEHLPSWGHLLDTSDKCGSEQMVCGMRVTCRMNGKEFIR